MIHNHHQNTRIRSITDRLCCIVVKEIKIFFNLDNYLSRSVTRSAIVIEVDSKGNVKTDTCSKKFRKVVEICTRRSTSMISNDTESQSEYSISQYY